MCSYETIFNSFGKLPLTYEIRLFFFFFLFLFFQMCSYETIFNSFGKLIDSYGVRNPMDLVAGLFGQLAALVGQTPIRFFGRRDLAYG
jgi:hypothetical protein